MNESLHDRLLFSRIIIFIFMSVVPAFICAESGFRLLLVGERADVSRIICIDTLLTF